MTRKKSNVKALALAVTCAILAGGGIGLEPVYAADVLYKEASGNVTTATKNGETDNTIINELTVGGVKIGSEDSFTGISIGSNSTSNHVIISDNDIFATGAVHASIIASGINARIENGKVVAQNGLYIGYTGADVTQATYDNSKFAVNGENGSFKAANGKFTVSDGGAITADSLELKETDGTTNVGAAIKDNANNIQAVNGKVTNIQTDVTSLQTTTGQLQTKVGELTASDTAARNDIISLQKKTAGISEDGSEITTKSLKLRESASSDTQEITAAKVKGYDEAVAAVGDTSTEGTLAYNTQKIRYADDDRVLTDKATYIEGITHAGDVRLADGEVRAKRIVLEEVFDDGTSGQATLTRESIVNLHGMIDGKTKIKVADGSEVGGVTFSQGKVTNVVSINDNLKFESDGIYLNKGDQAKQIKIGTDGKIIIGTSSSAYDTNGFYAGGDDYTEAKAAIDGINGKIKGANGAFGVDDNGNVTTTGDIKGKDITASGKLTVDSDATVGGNLGVTGDTTLKGKLDVTGDTTVGGDLTVTKKIKGESLNIGSTGNEFTVDANGNTAVGGTLGVTGDATVGGTLNVAGDTTLKGNLGVTGNATVGGTLGVTGDATFSGNIKGQSLNIGTTGNEFTVDTVGNVKANGITTSDTTTNKIGGVTLAGSDINAKNLTLTGTLTAAKYNATDIEATNSIKVGATTMTNGKLDLGSNGTIDFGANELTDVQVGNINSVIQPDGIVKAADGSVIGGVTFSAGNVTGVKDLTATGKVTAATITDGTASLSGGALTGLASVNIGGNTTIDNTGINTNKLIVGSGLNATTIDDANGVVSAKGEIGAVKFSGSGKLDNVNAIDGVSVAQNSGSAAGGLTFGGNAIIGATGIPFQSTGFKVDDDGDVEGKTFTTAADGTGNRSTLASGSLTIDANNTWTKDAGIIASNVKVGTNELKNDGLHVGTNTTVKDGELTVGAGNTWSMANGITASKAGINGVTIGETEGKATFNNAGNTTTIDGDKITTGTITADKLLINKISLGKDGSDNISIDQDGDVTTKGEIRITDAAGNVMTKLAKDSATFGNDVANQTVIEKGTVKAKAKSEDNQQAGLTFNENGLTVSGQNAAGQKSSFSFNAKTGANTFTGQDGTFTTINGSAITSTNGAATGVLNGSNLTLKNGANSTALEAGGATFTGAAGEKGGKTTTINGGTITTDTLNVERINLGEDILDSNGNPHGSNLSMDKQGNFSAAGGNFKVTGGSGADKGAMTNTVGNTTLKTDANGAGMSHTKDGVTSNVSVGNNKANVSAGSGSIDVTNESITSKVTDNATSTITKDSIVDKVGNNSVTTDANGTTFANGGSKTTNINGGTITTGKLITDELVITGKGEAAGTGTGSIAFGGNGTIKSDIKDGDKNTNFTTNIDGVTTKVTDGTTTTENKVTAAGNSNTVTKDDTHKSEFNQGLTSIGGVVTNGEIKVAQKLDGETGKLTSEVKDANGSSKLEQSGTGLEYTDSAKPDNATRINSSDVSIGSATDDSKRINLSDLGQIDDLDGELTKRDEYKKNQTAVGGINAEAAIRREEVARLDNRIDDVNTRVDKVGAMAAAIASLKSIGYDPQAPSEFSIGLGQYKGETGVAMGFFHYPNKNFMINVSLSTAGGETMGGIGATWRFGHKSPQKLLEEQREEQAKKELAAAEKYQAAAKLAKEAQERAEYAAKLARQAQVSADNAKAAADATQAKHFG
ncbi:YadA-like family protein [uncultured Phascolarctobacterium sp.]|uniref:YadA-like family protein n=1 Tax=uncultured Phascolarctobacterium sp. TaxID=512296 RepID=UPI0027DB3579|nr:YadA-like family protein [uncultured Phascolarctobacterium sp.]